MGVSLGFGSCKLSTLRYLLSHKPLLAHGLSSETRIRSPQITRSLGYYRCRANKRTQSPARSPDRHVFGRTAPASAAAKRSAGCRCWAATHIFDFTCLYRYVHRVSNLQTTVQKSCCRKRALQGYLTSSLHQKLSVGSQSDSDNTECIDRPRLDRVSE